MKSEPSVNESLQLSSNLKRHSIIHVDDPESDGPDDENEDEDLLDVEDDIPEDNLKANEVILTPRKTSLNSSFEARIKHESKVKNGF